jgi:hypothetical protein
MRSLLKKLSIEHLRGAVIPFELTFEKNKKLTVIYGENGSGKSTICDALEFVGNGKVGSLEKRGLGRWASQYWQSLGKKPGDISVTLETETASCKATVSKSDVSISPPDKQPRILVFRRAQILDLVLADPAERYTAISHFVDVSEIESCEQTLGDSIRNVEALQQNAIARLGENKEAIEKFWEDAGKQGTDPIKWAEATSKLDITSSETEANALADLQKAYGRIKEFPKKHEEMEKRLLSATQSLKKAQTDLDTSSKAATSEAADVLSVLESTKHYLSLHPGLATCPACESKEKAAGLLDRVNQRLAGLGAVRKAQDAKQKAEQEMLQATQFVEASLKTARQLTSEFIAVAKQAALPQGVPLHSRPVPDKVIEWPTWLSETAALEEVWKNAETARRTHVRFMTTLANMLKSYHANLQAAQDLKSLLPRLEKVLEIMQAERHKFTDETLSSIAQEVGRLYEAVHPGEGLDKISLGLDPKKRASLNIGASFLNISDAPPQAYFSDSHLDTLGICIFIALAGLEKPDETILVLDDVLGSVDEPHVDRLIEMLYEQATKFRHCVITTHYRPWRQKLRWGWLRTGPCQFVELSKWSSSRGITLVHSVPDVERLRQLLGEKSPDPQLVTSKAAVVLEAILDFLTQHYSCRVPRHADSSYTLGELLPAIDGKLRKALAIDILNIGGSGTATYVSEPLGPILDELTRIAQVRNVFGCHFNEISFSLLDADAIGFGQQVLKLAAILTDGVNGWPKNGKSGSYWATSGETRRLHPYVRPT